MGRIEVELLSARPEWEPEAGHDRRGRNLAAARGGCEHVAGCVNDVDVGRSAGVDARVASNDLRLGRGGVAWAKLRRGLVRIDQLPTASGVLLREQAVEGHVDKGRVAIV